MQSKLQNHPQSINPDAMYRARDCARLFGIGLSTWWGWSSTGKVQRGIRLGPKTTAWPGSCLLELRRKMIAESQGSEV